MSGNRYAGLCQCQRCCPLRTQNTSPFRFILNYSRATAANTYHLLYPKPKLAVALANDAACLSAVWQALNQIAPETMIGEGRVYGGGLHKVEPKELGNIPARSIVTAVSGFNTDHDHPREQLAVKGPLQLTLM